ncbi:MAG: hypothetical protein D6813_08470 [Calditrichaeota bacterium]|nr:MAG: hypothetical protein D6813_08470 [Calditrichota bacterium]
MRDKRFLEKYFFEISKHFISVATALFVGFTLAAFFNPEKLSAFVFLIAIIFYAILMIVALLFSYISHQFTDKEQGD